MIVSRNWLKQYTALDMPLEQLEHRLMMAGLNHEGTETIGDDFAIDLEVTSNRPDCLGHLGVAREIAVLWDQELTFPAASPSESNTPVTELTKVTLEANAICPRYTARVIRGVKIGPSPAWLVDRLATLGIGPVNNVVDITNYVLFECGQPLHAFDLARLGGSQIIVREAREGEKFEAINHKTYELTAGMCVIADADRPVALGGVMGGADTEVSGDTTDLLIESAAFDSMSIRTTARRLNLHSPSSYRFERALDPEGIDWASRRCCQLILELAGGELATGVIDTGAVADVRESVALRFPQVERILGIPVAAEEVRSILTSLGNVEQSAGDEQVEVLPPTWRSDLTREIDLIEEVARIHGYDKIPEDVRVPMARSARTDHDRGLEKVRQVLTALGYDEAMTISAVSEDWSAAYSPWSDAPPLRCSTPVLRGANFLRRSLVPSLLGARRINETLANEVIELFEIAKIYLPQVEGLPEEHLMLGLTSGEDFLTVKGAIESLLLRLHCKVAIEVRDTSHTMLTPGCCCELRLGDETLGYVGQVSAAGLKRFELRRPTTVAEVKLSTLLSAAVLVPQYAPQSPYPAVDRDINLEVDQSVRWADIEAVVTAHGGDHLERLDYRDTYRDDQLIAAGKKSVLLSAVFRWADGTLTNQQVDQVRDAMVAACRDELGAELRG
jgi:phenylalanyl-tRNA synthetase beta chain